MISFNPSPDRPRAIRLTASIHIRSPVDAVFEFFADASNLEVITPPWLGFRIDTPLPITMEAGIRIDYRLRLRSFPVRWQTEISDWNPPNMFIDRQRKGPYRLWEHTHRFEPYEDGTHVIDSVDYIVPGGCPVERVFVRPQLRKIFAYRHNKIAVLFSKSRKECDAQQT